VGELSGNHDNEAAKKLLNVKLNHFPARFCPKFVNNMLIAFIFNIKHSN